MKTEKIHRGIVRIEKQNREIGRLTYERDVRFEAFAWAAPRHLIGADLAEKARGQENRSERNTRIWKLGNLVRIAGLLDLDKEVLLGALRRAVPFESNPKWLARWRADGQRILAALGGDGDLSRGPELLNPRKDVDPKAARKALNHRLMTAGGILEQAGMGCWAPAVLVGVLAAIARHRDDPKRVATWKAAGAADAEYPVDVHAHVEVRFPEPIARELGRELAKLGITFDREKLTWMGFADPTLAQRAAEKGDGEVRTRAKSKTRARKTRPQKNRRAGGNGAPERSHFGRGRGARSRRRRNAD